MRRKELNKSLVFKGPKLATSKKYIKIVTCFGRVGNTLLPLINKRNSGKCNSQSHRSLPRCVRPGMI